MKTTIYDLIKNHNLILCAKCGEILKNEYDDCEICYEVKQDVRTKL